jgi:hypothetical protein
VELGPTTLFPLFTQVELGGFLFRLSALGAAQLFTCQFLVEGLATVDADLAALVFSAHALIVASRATTWQK